jgi:class 3 adenylate cyclase
MPTTVAPQRTVCETVPGSLESTVQEATFVVTDVVESTRLASLLGERRWLEVMRAHNASIRERARAFKAQDSVFLGDGFLIVFPSPDLGLACATSIQLAFADRGSGSDEHSLRVRIGVHIGPACNRNGDWLGLSLVLASRIADAANGQEILVSEGVLEALRSIRHPSLGSAPRPHSFRDVALKGFSQRKRLFSLPWHGGVPAPTRQLAVTAS